MGRNARWIVLAATAVLAACGGSTPTTGPGGATPAPGATAAPVTAAPVATPPTQGGPGSGFTGDPCSLLTSAEVEAVTGVPITKVTPTPMQQGSGGCGWSNEEGFMTIGAAITVTTGQNANAVWDTMVAQADSEAIPGIGDAAIYIPAQETIMFKKGATLIVVVAGPITEPENKREHEIELAKLIAGRL